MATIATIEGLESMGSNPKRKRRGLTEVIAVTESREDPTVCVASNYGPIGSAGGKSVLDFCLEARNSRGELFKTYKAGSTKKDLVGLRRKLIGREAASASLEGTMDYEDAVDFPTIEDLDGMDALIPPGFVKEGLVGLGANVVARLLGDLTKLIPGPTFIRPIAKVVVGIAGGRAAWGMSPVGSLMLMDTLIGSAIYDDLVKVFLGPVLPAVFGQVTEEAIENMLAQLTEEEQALLSQVTEEHVEGLDAGDGEPTEIVVGEFNSMHPGVGSFIN